VKAASGSDQKALKIGSIRERPKRRKSPLVR